MAIAAGTKAPDFALKSRSATGTTEVRLSEHFGSDAVVLVFFPAAFSGVCTTELCTFSENLNAYSDLGVVIYGISVDSAFAQEGWAKVSGITIPLLSDYGRRVIKDYDVELPDFAGLGGSSAQRAVFVINKEGVVAYSQQTASAGELPDFAALEQAVRAL